MIDAEEQKTWPAFVQIATAAYGEGESTNPANHLFALDSKGGVWEYEDNRGSPIWQLLTARRIGLRECRFCDAQFPADVAAAERRVVSDDGELYALACVACFDRPERRVDWLALSRRTRLSDLDAAPLITVVLAKEDGAWTATLIEDGEQIESACAPTPRAALCAAFDAAERGWLKKYRESVAQRVTMASSPSWEKVEREALDKIDARLVELDTAKAE